MRQALNPITMPLQGISLIEASAGTGKTFNIAALFARLILLEQLPIETILVVTFTKAATAELKTRLRTRLNQALALLQNQLPPEQIDPVLQQLIDSARSQSDDVSLILRLQAAITQFDSAAVYTIHGFCQRILTDYAFLCQTPFDTETINTDPELLCRFAEDFWRKEISNNTKLASLAVAKKLTPAKLMQQTDQYCGLPNLFIRKPPVTDLSSINTTLQQLWQQLCIQFDDIQQAFWQLQPQLNQNSYRAKSYQQFFNELAQAIELQSCQYTFSKNTLEKFAKFDATNLSAKAKQKQLLNKDLLATVSLLAELGQAIEAKQTAEDHSALQLQIDCFEYVRQCLFEHRHNSHQRSFDDLLADVEAALSTSNPQASTLAAALAQTWQIALVDECQDTDPLQYHIFKTAFAKQQRPLIMVGDPKQAIYRFRGADIHAYLRAAADTPAQQRYTLFTNYRSHQALVHSITQLFTAKDYPFILKGIDYPPVQAQAQHSKLRITSNNTSPPAVVVRWLHEKITVNEKGYECVPNKDNLRARSADSCAHEIAAMINQGQRGELKLESRALLAGDIAVLVHSHKEGHLMAKALKRCGISSVSLGNHTVFNTSEAEAVTALLRFWLQPQYTQTLRFILGGVLFGWTAAQLADLNHDESALNTWIQLALTAREQWQQYGIYTALQWFTTQTGLESKLLNQANERSLTNFWQLAELLAIAEQTMITANSLLAWLEQAISSAVSPKESDMLRLESDEALVKIVTMHSSKGLEYPIVFCPFAWDGKDAISNFENWHRLHEQGNIAMVARNLLSESDKIELTEENMAEQLRLYYVAFTRAREQLILYSAACSSIASNPLAWLLGGKKTDTLTETQTFWQITHKKHQISTLHQLWQNFLVQNPDPNQFKWCEGMPAPACVISEPNLSQPYQAQKIQIRPFTTIPYTSFTGLSQHNQQHYDQNIEEERLAPALDQAEVLPTSLPAESPAETPILGFARGINAGLCLHAILEQIEFTQPITQTEIEYIQTTLQRFGFTTEHSDTMRTLSNTVRYSPLSPHTILADIPKQQRVVEMNFMLHITDFDVTHLQQWFAQPHLNLPNCCIQAAQKLDFRTVNGFINGAIDLVVEDQHGQIYVIDYKSNYLGNQITDYQQHNMDITIAKHHYYLQALIYSIACARYLQTQNSHPKKINVRYLFLRGLNQTNQNGIWQWDIATADLAYWLGQHDKAK